MGSKCKRKVRNFNVLSDFFSFLFGFSANYTTNSQSYYERDSYTSFRCYKVLGVDESGSIITSDSPVVSQAPDYDMEKLEKIEFPISSKLVLFMFGGKQKEQYRKNSLFPLNKSEVKIIQRDIACSAEEWVYSIRPLTTIEKEIVREGRAIKQYIMENSDDKNQ